MRFNAAVVQGAGQSGAARTLGGAEKPKDLATATRSSRCTLKMDFSWWLLYASRKERYASRAACAGINSL